MINAATPTGIPSAETTAAPAARQSSPGSSQSWSWSQLVLVLVLALVLVLLCEQLTNQSITSLQLNKNPTNQPTNQPINQPTGEDVVVDGGDGDDDDDDGGGDDDDIIPHYPIIIPIEQ